VLESPSLVKVVKHTYSRHLGEKKLIFTELPLSWGVLQVPRVRP
jgi:hypothetical protein